MSDPVQLLPESLVPVHGPDVHWSRNLFHLFHFLWDVTCVLRIAVKLSVDGTITRLPVGREHLVKKVSCCSWSRRRTKLWFSWWCCLWFWRLGRLLWLDQSKCPNNNYIWPSQLGYKGGNIKAFPIYAWWQICFSLPEKDFPYISYQVNVFSYTLSLSYQRFQLMYLIKLYKE